MSEPQTPSSEVPEKPARPTPSRWRARNLLGQPLWFLGILPIALVVFVVANARSWKEPTFAGVWHTEWRDGQAQMWLERNGATITGRYLPYKGTLRGTVEGRTLSGTWTDPSGSGLFEFTLSRDGKSFIGNYGTGEWWNGSRVPPGTGAEYLESFTRDSPREALYVFLSSVNRLELGQSLALLRGIESIDFEGYELTAPERATAALALYRLLNLCTLRLYELTDAPVRDDITYEFRRAGTDHSIFIDFRTRENDWRIVYPGEAAVEEMTLALEPNEEMRVRRIREYAELASPRDALSAFLVGTQIWQEEGASLALSALDLGDIDAVAREIEGALLAEYLVYTLVSLGKVMPQELPDSHPASEPYTLVRHPLGDIVLAASEVDGRTMWRFTRETLAHIQAIYLTLELNDELAPLDDSPLRRLGFGLRNLSARASPWLSTTYLRVELWQWVLTPVLLSLTVLATTLLVRFFEWLLRGSAPLSLYGVGGFRLRFSLPGRFWLTSWFMRNASVALALDYRASELYVAIWSAALYLFGAWLLFGVVSYVGVLLAERAQGTATQLDDIAVTLLAAGGKISVVVMGLSGAARALGIPYETVVAGLGISGLALAIAARDTLTNLFGSAVMAVERPFKNGDFLKFDGLQGTVERVGLRSSRIRTLEDTVLIIPNSKLSTSILENYALRRRRRLDSTLYVDVETPVKTQSELLERIRSYLGDHPKVNAATVVVGIERFSIHAVEVRMRAYMDVVSVPDDANLRDELYRGVIGIAEALQVNLVKVRSD